MYFVEGCFDPKIYHYLDQAAKVIENDIYIHDCSSSLTVLQHYNYPGRRDESLLTLFHHQ